MSAGIGLVLLLRWFWWRINAWSEISAMVAPYVIYPVLAFGFDLDVIQADFELCLIIIVIWSTIVWLSVTFLTKPEKDEKLKQLKRWMSDFNRIAKAALKDNRQALEALGIVAKRKK